MERKSYESVVISFVIIADDIVTQSSQTFDGGDNYTNDIWGGNFYE